MTGSDPAEDSAPPTAGMPHQIDHRHADVSGGWLRAATFGAMDGLVSNTGLIAGVAASASAHAVLLAGVAGLLAARLHGARRVHLHHDGERATGVRGSGRARVLPQIPNEERAELVAMLMDMGMTESTATAATDEIRLRREPGTELPPGPGARGDDAVRALVGLGYGPVVAEDAVRAALGDGAEAETPQLIRRALRQLASVRGGR